MQAISSKSFIAETSRIGLLFLFFFVSCAALVAVEQKKEEKKKPEPPVIAMVIPLGITPELTNIIRIRGQNLSNVTELRFTETNCRAEIIIKSKAKVEVPKDTDPRKAGDTQLELELKLAGGAPLGTNMFILLSPDGESSPHPLLVLQPGSLANEKEPNGGFREAERIEFDQRVQGAVHEPRDVDVFRFSGKTGQRVVAEVFAARFGSLLDSVLTLYDQHGHIVAANDDSDASADSLLRVKLASDGDYFLSLIDAHDRGSPAHVYQLLLRLEE
jgi:hypothetical protein